ncbi:uncharacterized protein EV154DRAFT_482628 [Mucor mucedo]|uniref:uncharacterized protein n=1 Tax=Mucor mucedo TaxID=29922 RepID=UPI00222045EF|nr:uncharacterized protein EV154DRAFT_482628 [Mucor mucedo]KAI7889912.1 hypothetical protein EV154DRAFT_482628 [Mucor mucedo]
MKFSALSIAALATAATTVSANFTLSEPWSTSVWTSGGNASVAWTSVDEAGKKCEIHLLTGNATAATFVSNLTAHGNLVPCDFTRANLHPLPDYISGDYFVRFGENGGDTANYAYSGYFKYVGNGTASYETLTTTPAPAAAAVATPAADASVVQAAVAQPASI